MNDNNISGGLREKASGLADSAKQQANSFFDTQKSAALSEVTQLADALRRAGSELEGSRMAGNLINMAADRLESLSSGMENRSLEDIKTDVERFARRNPAAFIGGAMVLGVIAARFLKSHAHHVAGFLPQEAMASRYAANDIETPIVSAPTTTVGSDFGGGGSSASSSNVSSGLPDNDSGRGVIR